MNVSATTPWPGKAASPCRMIGSAAFVSCAACGPWRVVCAARVAPIADRADVLEVARVRLQPHDQRAAVGQLLGAARAVVVLDVAGAALRDRGDHVERRLALELGEDRAVGAAEVVREHVEAAAVRHPDDDLAAAVGAGEPHDLVDDRDRHVEALDRELLLAEVGLVHEALERVDLDQPLEQRLALVARERVAEGAGLDLLAQPHALAVAGDVLDLVGDRAAVGLSQVRQRVGEGRAGDAGAQDARRGSAPSARASVSAASGSSAGSPTGSEPSGSSCAARWPCVR